MLEAMSSCLLEGFLLWIATVLVVAVLLMVLSPLRLLLLFMPCAACTYMPNASWRRRGGKAQGEGSPHPEQSGGRAKRRSAQAKRGRLLGNPLCCARAEPSAKVWFPHACASAHRI